jgi:hypothetical protein
MKKIFSLVILLMPVLIAYPQDTDTQMKKDDEFKTIFGGKKIGGYGSVGAGYSYVDQDAAVTFDAGGYSSWPLVCHGNWRRFICKSI